MKFGYLITMMLYALTTVSLGTAGCGPAYAGKVDTGQLLQTVAAGVDIVDSCALGTAKECSEQTADPVKTCLFERAMKCVGAVTSGTHAVLGMLGWVPSFRQAGPFGSGTGDPSLAAAQCVAALDSEDEALRCARGVPTRSGADCIAEGVARCIRVSGDVPLRVTLAEAPPGAAPPTPAALTAEPDTEAR